ncbi:LBP_cg2779 family protein [Limosilactobacillus agrestimuris]|uniref:LBP_cg2779 family protein n=1 Tax=Limosilactobacillus agrestimuris TaxID=2941331 RepID=UPI00203E7DAC|nr:LBP_cg2779 family protein [Limosilactobacillus agrestimuris]
MDNLNEIAQELIKFEREQDMNDNQVAFGSHLSVERIHDIKSGNSDATEEEAELIERFMQSNNSSSND